MSKRKLLIGTLQYLAARMQILNAAHRGEVPVSRADDALSMKDWVDHALKQEEGMTPDLLAALNDAKLADDEDQVQALFEARVTEINNYLRASSNWLGLLYDTETLGERDWAEFENNTRREVSCGYLAEDGTPRTTRGIAKYSRERFLLRYVSTPWYEYPLVNLNYGPVEKVPQMVELGMDLQFKIDQLAYTLYKATPANGGALGDFTTTGDDWDRTWHLHSSILEANLPTTNDLTLATSGYSLASASTSTKFNLDVMREIDGYYGQLRPIMPGLDASGVIIVNSKEAGHISYGINPLTLNTDNEQLRALTRGYTSIPYLNKNWIIVPDITIPGKLCYPVPNQPVGKCWIKPVYDKTLVKRDEEKNLERRMEARGVAFAIPKQWTPRACRVRYTTDG